MPDLTFANTVIIPFAKILSHIDFASVKAAVRHTVLIASMGKIAMQAIATGAMTYIVAIATAKENVASGWENKHSPGV